MYNGTFSASIHFAFFLPTYLPTYILPGRTVEKRELLPPHSLNKNNNNPRRRCAWQREAARAFEASYPRLVSVVGREAEKSDDIRLLCICTVCSCSSVHLHTWIYCILKSFHATHLVLQGPRQCNISISPCYPEGYTCIYTHMPIHPYAYIHVCTSPHSSLHPQHARPRGGKHPDICTSSK
jgi:hypothetical protein